MKYVVIMLVFASLAMMPVKANADCCLVSHEVFSEPNGGWVDTTCGDSVCRFYVPAFCPYEVWKWIKCENGGVDESTVIPHFAWSEDSEFCIDLDQLTCVNCYCHLMQLGGVNYMMCVDSGSC